MIDFTRDDGKQVPAVVIGTKAGQIYVLDRATGQPLTRVEEVPVKAANIPNEPYSLTQPKSVGMPQIGAQTLTESDMWGATPFDQLLCRIDFKKMRYDGLYTAPGTDLSLSFPGSLGGMNWGSLSTDPVNGFIFVNDMRLGLWIQMIPSANKGSAAGGGEAGGGEALNTGMGAVPLKGTPYAVNKNRFLSVAGIPCQAPPYGTLTAIDMKTRQIAWQWKTPARWASACTCRCRSACRPSAAPCRPRAAWCSSPVPRTSTCAPSTAATARKSGNPACPWAARVAR